MSKYGLHKKLTFDTVLEDGREYDLTNVHVWGRSALNFRQGFFAPPEPIEDVVDENQDDRHQQHLAQMRAAAEQQARQHASQMDPHNA